MAISRYEKLVNTVVNGIYVSDYKRLQKISKSGRVYKVGRLTVAYETSKDVTLNIGISSWTNWTFIKNLDKANGKKQQKTKQTKTKQQTKTTNGKIFTEFGWYTPEEHEQIKQAGKRRKVQQQTTYDPNDNVISDLCFYVYVGKHRAENNLQHVLQHLKEFTNMNVYGQTIFNSPEEYCNWRFKNWEQRLNEQLQKGINRHSEYDYTIAYTALEELRTEFKQKVCEAVVNEWDNVEKRRHKAQKEWRDKHYGSDWEQQWERKNFGSKTINTKDNEFTVEFKGCTTVKEVKQVYRRLSKQWHPDMPTGDTVKMAKVNEAYENAMSRVA